MKKSRDVLVNYNYIIGDVEVFGQVLIEIGDSETLEDTIHGITAKTLNSDSR
jgi:hypothetical protein